MSKPFFGDTANGDIPDGDHAFFLKGPAILNASEDLLSEEERMAVILVREVDGEMRAAFATNGDQDKMMKTVCLLGLEWRKNKGIGLKGAAEIAADNQELHKSFIELQQHFWQSIRGIFKRFSLPIDLELQARTQMALIFKLGTTIAEYTDCDPEELLEKDISLPTTQNDFSES